MADYARECQRMKESSAPARRKTWLSRVRGETGRDLIKGSFLAGKGPGQARWMSNAA